MAVCSTLPLSESAYIQAYSPANVFVNRPESLMGCMPAFLSENGISATPVVPPSDRNFQEWEISDDEDERLARQVLRAPHGLIEPSSTAEIGGSVRTGTFRPYLYLSILIYKCTPSE